jgi:hypothetical protein
MLFTEQIDCKEYRQTACTDLHIPFCFPPRLKQAVNGATQFLQQALSAGGSIPSFVLFFGYLERVPPRPELFQVAL